MDNKTKKQSSGIRPDTLLASVVVLLAVNVVQRSIGFGRGVLFCRWLDPESLGQWDMAYGFLLLAAPVAVLGLPGSFGRYLERYRQRGQLRTFLLRTCTWTASLAALAIVFLVLFRGTFAYVVFGSQQQQTLLLLVAATLAAVILHHFLEAVFAGLRLFRVVSAMHFAQSMMFAALSLTLLTVWRRDEWSVVAGYGLACLLSACGVLVWSRRLKNSGIPAAAADSHGEFWPPLLRFAVWVWVTNVLSNLFSVIDRYMIVHCSGLPADEALGLVGHYHTSMLVPVLLVSVANLLAGAMTPHLSHQWESGDQPGVARTINLSLKLAALGMFAGGLGVLWVTPSLFHYAFGGKYDAGLQVLPWALTSCVWFSLLLVAQTYVWCAEKTRQACLPLALGLVGNVVLNLILLPKFGLQGAVMATALATLMALGTQLWVNYRHGMAVGGGTLLFCLTPLGLVMGGDIALAVGGIVALLVIGSNSLFTSDERSELLALLAARVASFAPFFQKLTSGDAQ